MNPVRWQYKWQDANQYNLSSGTAVHGTKITEILLD
jgi:hypothetical protein